MQSISFLLVLIALFMVNGLGKLEQRDLEEEAYQCAIHSEKTDQAICDCYTERGLDAPF